MRSRTVVTVIAGLVVVAAVAVSAGPVHDALTAGAGLVVDAGDSLEQGAAPHLDLVTIDQHAVVTQSHDSPAFLPLAVDGRYRPGRPFRLAFGVADNDPDTGAAVTVAILPMDAAGTGRLGTSPNLTPFLLVTVVDTTTGQVLIGGSASDPGRGAPVADASATLDRLQPRHADPLTDGSRWVDGAQGSRHDLEVTVLCPDTPTLRALAGAGADLALMVYGTGSP